MSIFSVSFFLVNSLSLIIQSVILLLLFNQIYNGQLVKLQGRRGLPFKIISTGYMYPMYSDLTD